MEIFVLFGVLLLLLTLGVPVAFSLLGAALATFWLIDIPLVVAVQRMAAGISVFTLMAIPFFIFAGDLMYRSGIADRLVSVADAAFGRVRGGLGLVDVGASMMFGAVSGSAIASASAIGSTMVPLMEEKGYPGDYAVNVTVTAAVVGLLIPPSHNMIIYAAASGVGVSIGDLFLAGIIPGLLTGFMLMLTAWLVARRRDLPRGTFPGWRKFISRRRLRDSRPDDRCDHYGRHFKRDFHAYRIISDRCYIYGVDWLAGLPQPWLEGFWRGRRQICPHRFHGAFHHCRRDCLWLRIGIARSSRAARRADCADDRQSDHDAANHQRDVADARHIYGYGAAHCDHDTDLPAGCDGGGD